MSLDVDTAYLVSSPLQDPVYHIQGIQTQVGITPNFSPCLSAPVPHEGRGTQKGPQSSKTGPARGSFSDRARAKNSWERSTRVPEQDSPSVTAQSHQQRQQVWGTDSHTGVLCCLPQEVSTDPRRPQALRSHSSMPDRKLER